MFFLFSEINAYFCIYCRYMYMYLPITHRLISGSHTQTLKMAITACSSDVTPPPVGAVVLQEVVAPPTWLLSSRSLGHILLWMKGWKREEDGLNEFSSRCCMHCVPFPAELHYFPRSLWLFLQSSPIFRTLLIWLCQSSATMTSRWPVRNFQYIRKTPWLTCSCSTFLKLSGSGTDPLTPEELIIELINYWKKNQSPPFYLFIFSRCVSKVLAA